MRHALTFDNVNDAKRFVWNNSFACVVTKDEDAAFTSAGFRSVGDATNPWTRYVAVKGIYVLDVIHNGSSFLSDFERQPLSAPDLSRGIDDLKGASLRHGCRKRGDRGPFRKLPL